MYVHMYICVCVYTCCVQSHRAGVIIVALKLIGTLLFRKVWDQWVFRLVKGIYSRSQNKVPV